MAWSSNTADQNLARVVLASLRGVPQTQETNEVAKSCRRILDGQGTKADMIRIRGYRGIRRSGASGLRGAGRAMIGTARQFSAITRDAELAGSGNTTAQARFAATVADSLSTALTRNRKAIIAVGESVAKSLGQNPAIAARFVYSLGRVLRMGGAIGMVAGAAVTAAKWSSEQQQQGFEAENKIRSTWWRLKSRAKATALEAEARDQVFGERWIAGRDTGIPFVDDLLLARWSKKTAERFERLAQITETKRGLVAQDASRGGALHEIAAGRGIPIENMTEKQVNAALDGYRRRKRIGGVKVELPDQLDPTADEKDAFFARKKSELRMGMEMGTAQDLFSWGLSWEELWYRLTPGAHENEWMLELREQKLQRETAARAARRERQQRKRELMNPAQVHMLEIRRQESEANAAEYRSRHQVVIPD
jgi:hypothetical protein